MAPVVLLKAADLVSLRMRRMPVTVSIMPAVLSVSFGIVYRWSAVGRRGGDVPLPGSTCPPNETPPRIASLLLRVHRNIMIWGGRGVGLRVCVGSGHVL